MSMNELLYPSSFVRLNNNIPTWYEFLLRPDLLSEHLSKPDPEPNGCLLIKQFFDQANRHVNEQGQILPPPENKRNKAVKSLALQTAALLQWDLDIFEKKLPIAARHQLLSEFMKACKTTIPFAPGEFLSSAIENLHDHALMSMVLYCQWGARTIVKSTFPCKPGGRITPTIPQSVPYQANAQQRCDEVRDQIIVILKDQVFGIVQFLEAVLHHVKRSVFMPSYKTFALQDLCKSIDGQAGTVVTCEELHAQICYDLGCLHFAHNFYEKAGEMFGHVGEWLKRLPEKRSSFCNINEAALNGYRIACQMVNKPANMTGDLLEESDSLFVKVNKCLLKRGSSLRNLGEIIIEDIYKRELSTAFLDEVERELLKNDGNFCGGDIQFDVKWSNAVRRAVRGLDQPTGLWTFDMNIAQLQRIVGFVQQASVINHVESHRLGMFLFSLANNVTDQTLREQLLNFEVTCRLIDTESMNELILRLKTERKRPLVLENESPDSPEDEAQSPTTAKQISLYEQTLLRTFDPFVIKDTLTQLYSIASGRKFFNFCPQWELPAAYCAAITSSTPDTVRYDVAHIVIAKSHHCFLDGDFASAKQLITYVAKNYITNEEVKIQKIAKNELLRLELIELLSDESLNYADQEECSELRAQLSDVVSRCRQLLATSSAEQLNIFPGLVDLCTAMLLNLEDLTFFMGVTRSSNSPPCLKLAYILASVRSSLIDRSMDTRKPANDLWSASIIIFSTSNTSGRNSSKKSSTEPLRNLLPTNAIISRPLLIEFLKLIKNSAILDIMVSLLVHLHRLCRNDILSDITSPGTGLVNTLWPTGLDNTQLSGPCVTLALREILEHCISIQPKNASWLRTQADIHYAFDNHNAALRAYLLLGAYLTNYFNNISSTGPYDDEQIIQRMIKCCMQMKCFTQAAVLCQFEKHIDYSTAFKALQENRERTDAAEAHYLEHVWDVQLLEHAAFEHRESGESLKKSVTVSASTRPELNHNNLPSVTARVRALRQTRFFQSMARQYLCL